MKIGSAGLGLRCTILATVLNFLAISSVQSAISQRDKNDIKNFLVNAANIYDIDITSCGDNEVDTCVHYHQYDSKEDESARKDIADLKEEFKQMREEIIVLKEQKRVMSKKIDELEQNVMENVDEIDWMEDLNRNIDNVKQDISNIRISVGRNSKNTEGNANNIKINSDHIKTSSNIFSAEVARLDRELNTGSTKFNELTEDVIKNGDEIEGIQAKVDINSGSIKKNSKDVLDNVDGIADLGKDLNRNIDNVKQDISNLRISVGRNSLTNDLIRLYNHGNKVLDQNNVWTIAPKTATFYLRTSKYYTQAEARIACKKYGPGSSLASIRNGDELSHIKNWLWKIRKNIGSYQSKYSWTDLKTPKATSDRTKWVWANDGVVGPTADEYWLYPSPSSSGQSTSSGSRRFDECAYFYAPRVNDIGLNNYLPCTYKMNAICEIRL